MGVVLNGVNWGEKKETWKCYVISLLHILEEKGRKEERVMKTYGSVVVCSLKQAQ